MKPATIAAITLMLFSASCSKSGDCEFASGRTCQDGETCTADDGCNRCGCEKGGLLCTLMGCSRTPKPRACDRETPAECTTMTKYRGYCTEYGSSFIRDMKYCPSSTNCPSRDCLEHHTIPGEEGVFWCCPVVAE